MLSFFSPHFGQYDALDGIFEPHDMQNANVSFGTVLFLGFRFRATTRTMIRTASVASSIGSLPFNDCPRSEGMSLVEEADVAVVLLVVADVVVADVVV